jgi:hypothetical protein
MRVPIYRFARGYKVAIARKILSEQTGTPKKCSLIKLEPIIEIIRASIWTGKLSDEKPVSVMLIAEQESAKTEALKFFRGTPTIHYMSDLTSRGLSVHKDAIQNGKLKHIVLLDLVRILSHGKGVSERTIQTLASLMEEGESETADGGGKTTWENFPRIGALMGITPSFFKAKRGKWRQTGFLTRFLPVSFTYKDTTVDLIHRSIAKGTQTPLPSPEKLPDFTVQIACKEEFASVISLRAKSLGISMRSYGFRYHRILRALAKAQARICGRGMVTTADIDKVLAWSEFFTDKEVEL